MLDLDDSIFKCWGTVVPQSCSQKTELKSLIKDEIGKESQKCKPAADILRQNLDEVVEILVKCYKNSPEKELPDYVWNFIKKDSKFVEIKILLFAVANVLENSRQNIIDTEDLAQREMRIQGMMQKQPQIVRQEEPPPKKLKTCDPRPVNNDFVLPKSIFDDTYFNKTLSAVANKVMKNPPETVQREEEETEHPSKRSTNSDPRPVDPAFVPPKSRLHDDDFGRTTAAAIKRKTSDLKEKESSSTVKDATSTKSVGFSTSSSAETNSSQSLNNDNRNILKSPPPPQELTSEEEDESEMHICPPRNLNYYSRFASKEKAVVSPQNDERNADEHLLDSDNEESSDVVIPESQDRLENNTVLSQNDEEDNDNDVPQYPPRNLDIYKSLSSSSNATSTSIQPVIRRSVFDDVSDEEEIPSDRQKKIVFDEETAADNEHVPKKIDPYSGNSRGSALQPHETIDKEHKVNMEGPNPTRLLTAFPNQMGPCHKPECLVLEKWKPVTHYEDDINDAFFKFKNSEYVTNLIDKSPEHLFIFDSMMSGIPFEKTYKKVVCIDCGFPNNPFNIIRHLKTEITEKRNDYVIKNVFICIGLDFLTYDPDEKRARKNTTDFFEQFLNLTVKAFDPRNGPKRYKRELKKSHINKNAFLDVTPPKLIFITIPQVKGSQLNVNLNNDIIQMNKKIRLFVKDCKEAAEQKRVILEIYDWEKIAAIYDQCNKQHLEKRNGILMKYLSTEHALLMHRPEEP